MNTLNHRRKWKQGNSSGQTVSLPCPAASPASHYNLRSARIMCSSCHARSQPAESSPVHEVVPHTTPINALHLSLEVWKRVKFSLTNTTDVHAGTVCAPEPSCECEPRPGWSQSTGLYELPGPGLPYCCREGKAGCLGGKSELSGFMPCFAQGVAFALFYSLESREVY